MTDWREEGRKAFVASRARPDSKLPANYPTQDVHTPADEREYLEGWKEQEAIFKAGKGFAGLESYAQELEEDRAEGRRLLPLDVNMRRGNDTSQS